MIIGESTNSDNPGADADGAVRLVSVEPLAIEPAAALTPVAELGMRAVVLVRAAHRWQSAYGLETCRRAPDLLAAAAACPDICDLFPKGAELIEAGIEIYFNDSVRPCLVQLKPPDQWVVQPLGFTDRALAFLRLRGFLKTADGASFSGSLAKNLLLNPQLSTTNPQLL
jgi:hypothetical protein